MAENYQLMINDFTEIIKQYSNEDLLQMVYQFEQWDSEMLAAVEAELMVKNIFPEDISIVKMALIEKEDRILSEGKEATFSQQFLGWIGVFGILGLIIGYELAFAKTKGKYTGKEYLKYDEASRENGRYMYYISITIITAFCLYKFANFMERY